MQRLILREHKKLCVLEGLFTEREGQHLAWLASRVPADRAIVELGSFMGKSTCFLGAGSRAGFGAHVTCVDLWDRSPSSRRAADPKVRRKWETQVRSMDLRTMITPIQASTVEAAEKWDGNPVGLLHVDAGHGYKSVKADFESWSPFIPSGGFVAFHDYENPRWYDHVKRYVDKVVIPSGEWTDVVVYDRLLSARRV